MGSLRFVKREKDCSVRNSPECGRFILRSQSQYGSIRRERQGGDPCSGRKMTKDAKGFGVVDISTLGRGCCEGHPIKSIDNQASFYSSPPSQLFHPHSIFRLDLNR